MQDLGRIERMISQNINSIERVNTNSKEINYKLNELNRNLKELTKLLTKMLIKEEE